MGAMPFAFAITGIAPMGGSYKGSSDEKSSD
jgi:hypothetical protein